MPKKFTFLIDNHQQFSGELESEQCEGKTINGSQCKRTTVIGTRWCYSHLLKFKHLRIKKSTLPNGGVGLYCVDCSTENDIVFRAGYKIISYDGELIDKVELEDRYGNYTAPYGIQINKDKFEDGALHRGVGTLVNHKAHSQSNARFGVSRNRVVLIATKNIRSNTEIFVCYGREYRFNEPTKHKTK